MSWFAFRPLLGAGRDSIATVFFRALLGDMIRNASFRRTNAPSFDLGQVSQTQLFFFGIESQNGPWRGLESIHPVEQPRGSKPGVQEGEGNWRR